MKTRLPMRRHPVIKIFIGLISGLLFPVQVLGQTISLSVWPPLLETVIQPGKAITQVYKLKNLGDDTVLKVSVVGFEPLDNSGNVHLITNRPLAVADYFSLQNADLPPLPTTFALKSGQTQELVLKISVPPSALEADHYVSLLFESETKGLVTATGTTAQASIATNILLTVSRDGRLNPTAKIEKYFVTKLLDSFDSIKFTLLLQNPSPVRLKAIGQIEIKNMFKAMVATLPIREDNVLANSSRWLQGSELSGSSEPSIFWNPVFPLGWFTAKATITPKDTLVPATKTIGFLVLPYKALLAILSLTTIYLLTVKKLRFKIK